jgi:hypothetical protein
VVSAGRPAAVGHATVSMANTSAFQQQGISQTHRTKRSGKRQRRNCSNPPSRMPHVRRPTSECSAKQHFSRRGGQLTRL